MQKLISFIIPSRHFTHLRDFFDNLEDTVSDPQCIEVLIKLDDDQTGADAFIKEQVEKRPFLIRYIITPRFEGIPTLWLAMEQLFYMTDPSSYFIQLLSDEARFETQNWDQLLRNYIAFFKDHVFRLRLSSMKFCNYATHYECTFRPDSFPIYTRRWLELTEGTGDCWGSDAYHQCVAFQLSLGPGGYTNIYRENGICRDIVLYDIVMSGLAFSIGVSHKEKKKRHRQNLKEWARLTSYPMQEHFSYLARRINCYIWAHEQGIKHFILKKNEFRKSVAVIDAQKQEWLEISYALPRLIIYTQNLSRRLIRLPREMISASFTFFGFLVKKTFSKAESDTDLAALGSTKRLKMKSFLRKTLIQISVPMNIISHLFDRLLMPPPPGITTLSLKKKIPADYPVPSKKDCEWLRETLLKRKEASEDLQKKQFLL